jgi:hypothetical protein
MFCCAPQIEYYKHLKINNMRKIFTLLLAVFAASAAQAQGFSSISVPGAYTDAGIRPGQPLIHFVVPNTFDRTNVAVQYTVEEGSELVGEFPTNFTATQTVTVKKTDDSAPAKNWKITLNPITPAPLPLAHDFSTDQTTADWTPATIGWAYAGIDIAQTSVARYGNPGITFIAAFNESPKDVTYTLQSLGGGFVDGSQFDVDASANGITWRTIRSFQGTATGVPTTNTEYTTDLAATDRFVRWVYVTRQGSINVNLRKFSISKGEGGSVDPDLGNGAPLNIANSGYGLGKFSVKNALQVYTKASSTTRTALELHAVVVEDFDFTTPANAVLEAASGYTSDPATLPTNFATPQTVKFTKTADGTENSWTIYVKPIKPATTLPLELYFDDGNLSEWDNEVVGWATAGTNVNRAATVAFDSDKTSFIVGFTQPAKTLRYDLFINDVAPAAIPDDASFEIQTADESAKTWTLLYKYDKDNQIPARDAESVNHQLDLTSDVRYIKFVYANRGTGGKNLNLNNIIVSDVLTSIVQPNVAKQVFYQSAAGEIVFTQAVSKVEVYNLVGGLTAVYNHPATVSLGGAKGVALLRITLSDGTVVSQKILK